LLAPPVKLSYHSTRIYFQSISIMQNDTREKFSAGAASLNGLPVLDDDFLRQCIHCGLCLPACPTYSLTLREISSPRGRIRMMKNVAEGKMPLSETFRHEMFFCLDCRACETACPAGVPYGALVETARAQAQHARTQDGAASRLQNFVLRRIFTKPVRLRMLARMLYWLQCFGLFKLAIKLQAPRLFGRRLMELISLTPPIEQKFTFQRLAETLPAFHQQRYRVGLLTGCVQDVAFASVNEDTAEVLRYNGCEVVVPRRQVCCGSLHGHSGDPLTARQLARKNMEAFEAAGVETIVVNAAGCGSFMKNYAHLFPDDPSMSERAQKFSSAVRDVSEFLSGIGATLPRLENGLALTTYHDACHLAHGQKIVQPPRALVRAVAGDKFVELLEADWCCGSAGIYNITHFESAMSLLDRKMANLQRSGASCCITANPGCMIQLRYGAQRIGLKKIEVMHLATLLRRAYEGKATS
jgi:glycolate oxidase iron-sulfur subunit